MESERRFSWKREHFVHLAATPDRFLVFVAIRIGNPHAQGRRLFCGRPRDLDFEVDWDALAADTLKNLNDYWARYTDDPTRIAWLLSDYGIQWTVLGVLRQFYTLKERGIISKIGAGDYGVQRLPEQWSRLIQEAINIRRGNDSLYTFSIQRAWDAYRFLKWIIRECNAVFG